jgi:hypothetical protein
MLDVGGDVNRLDRGRMRRPVWLGFGRFLILERFSLDWLIVGSAIADHPRLLAWSAIADPTTRCATQAKTALDEKRGRGRPTRDARQAVGHRDLSRSGAPTLSTLSQFVAAALGLECVWKDRTAARAGRDGREEGGWSRGHALDSQAPCALDQEAAIIQTRRGKFAEPLRLFTEANPAVDRAMWALHWLITTRQLGLPPA